MSLTIGEAIKDRQQELTALKKVAKKYGDGVIGRTYVRGSTSITLWLVDMPLSECTTVQTLGPSRDDWGGGFALLFQPVGLGVNIAPKHHHRIDLNLLFSEATKNVKSLPQLIEIFERYGNL